MTKLRTIIVDDEPLALQRLKRLLGGEPDVEIIAECENGAAALDAIGLLHPDLLFLDIQMPEMDGFELLQQLDPRRLPAVVFVTGYDEYAVRAFKARALDYILKPPTRPRLAETLSRVRERHAAARDSAIPKELLELLAERKAAMPYVSRLSVRTSNRLTFVAVNEVDWIEAAGNYVVLHVGRTTHIIRQQMKALEAQLSPESFLRVSRSAILNLRRVKELQSVTPGDNVAILLDGQQIPMTCTIREVEELLRFG
jgi:two-component system LytT family response regulator